MKPSISLPELSTKPSKKDGILKGFNLKRQMTPQNKYYNFKALEKEEDSEDEEYLRKY